MIYIYISFSIVKGECKILSCVGSHCILSFDIMNSSKRHKTAVTQYRKEVEFKRTEGFREGLPEERQFI